jgi:hypothetical protein
MTRYAIHAELHDSTYEEKPTLEFTNKAKALRVMRLLAKDKHDCGVSRWCLEANGSVVESLRTNFDRMAGFR